MPTKHTPGPWVLVHDEPYSMSIEAGGERVPGLKAWLDDACYDANPERIANAQLAAAAPDLLHAGTVQHSALLSCLRYLLGNGPRPDPEELAAAEQMWLAAESKASP